MGSRGSKQGGGGGAPQDDPGGARSSGASRANGGGGGGGEGLNANEGAHNGSGEAGSEGSLRSRRRRRRRRASTSSGEAEHDSSDAALLEQAPRMSYWQMVRGGYEELVHAIIRPPRAEYSESVLGPTAFTVDGVIFEREDVWLRNKRDQRLACSHWKPKSLSEEGAHPKPCVIYLHGNASCRAEALETLPHILSSGMTLFAFDFAGSGHSEGEYISLGWYEREDLEAVVDHLRSTGKTSSIGLWGRSMGAATALMFAERDPSIAAMVLDSPFASLKQLAKELSSEVNVPHFLMGMALRMVRNSVRSRAHFDIFKLEPIKHAETSFIPALFGHGEEDHFILPHHSQQLYDAYAGDKNLRTFPGDHSSSRPQFFIDSVCIFLYNTLISTTEQDSDVVGHADPRNFDFALNYTMPPPMASPGARSPSASFSGAVPPGAAAGASEDVYEEAMLRHAIQLSLAEAQGTSGESTIAGAQGGVSTDELDAEFHDALQQSSFPSDNQKSDDRHQDDDDDDHEKDDDDDSATHAKNVKADEGGTTGASSNDVKLCHVSDNDDDESDIEDAALKAALEASMIESESSAIKNAGNDLSTSMPAPAPAPRPTRPPAPGIAGSRPRPPANPRPPAPTRGPTENHEAVAASRGSAPAAANTAATHQGRPPAPRLTPQSGRDSGAHNGDGNVANDDANEEKDACGCHGEDGDDENDFPSLDGFPLPVTDKSASESSNSRRGEFGS